MQISELIKLTSNIEITIRNNSGVLDVEIQTGKAKGDLYIENQVRMPFTNEQVSESLDEMVSKLIEKYKSDANSL